MLEVLERGVPGRSYNIGGNNEMMNIEVVTQVCDILDRRLGLPATGMTRRTLITFVKDRLGHDRRYAIDATRIREELGWQPQVDFEQGLEMTVDWYLANQDWVAAVVDGSYKEYYRTMYGGN